MPKHNVYRHCLLCGKSYVTPARSDRDRLCPDCRTPSLNDEVDRWRGARRTTERLGLETSLSFPQWVKSIKHFRGLCAYCQEKPFNVMEHFIPTLLGGGTTMTNCVPACQSCNTIKKNHHPDNCPLAKHTICRVRQYLQERRHE